jgi:hypothetical protein
VGLLVALDDAAEDLREATALAGTVVAQPFQLHQHLLQDLLEGLRPVGVRVALVVVRTDRLLVVQLGQRHVLKGSVISPQDLQTGRHLEDTLCSVHDAFAHSADSLFVAV